MTMQNQAIGSNPGLQAYSTAGNSGTSGAAGTTGTAGASGTDRPARSTRNMLDQQAFLQILVSKLQNQDPMSPMEDQDFIAQMAQFSALEQMQVLNGNFSFAQAAGLVGKHVQATLPDPQGGIQVVNGLVTRALMRNGVPCLIVDGREVPYDSSLVVYAPGTAAELPAEPASDT